MLIAIDVHDADDAVTIGAVGFVGWGDAVAGAGSARTCSLRSAARFRWSVSPSRHIAKASRFRCCAATAVRRCG
jgi:hypothetical protein